MSVQMPLTFSLLFLFLDALYCVNALLFVPMLLFFLMYPTIKSGAEKAGEHEVRVHFTVHLK